MPEQAADFWRQVAPRYKKAPRSVAFELLNEPHEKLNGEVWNTLLARALASFARPIQHGSWSSVRRTGTA